MKSIKEVLSWRGELGRGLYIVVGLALFLIKWNLDRLLSGYFFSVSWMPYRYLIPGMEDTHKHPPTIALQVIDPDRQNG